MLGHWRARRWLSTPPWSPPSASGRGIAVASPCSREIPPGRRTRTALARRRAAAAGIKLPLDRQLRFAWFRFLVSQDGPGLNVVRGSVRRQMAAIEEGRTYANLPPQTKAAYATDEGELDGLASAVPRRVLRRRRRSPARGDAQARGERRQGGDRRGRKGPNHAAAAVRGAEERADAGRDVRYELMPMASHPPMEEALGVRERFEAIVVDVVSAL